MSEKHNKNFVKDIKLLERLLTSCENYLIYVFLKGLSIIKPVCYIVKTNPKKLKRKSNVFFQKYVKNLSKKGNLKRNNLFISSCFMIKIGIVDKIWYKDYF